MLHSNLFPYQSVPNTTLQILEGGQEHGPGPGTEDALLNQRTRMRSQGYITGTQHTTCVTQV